MANIEKIISKIKDDFFFLPFIKVGVNRPIISLKNFNRKNIPRYNTRTPTE
jgi:hypothetical protein